MKDTIARMTELAIDVFAAEEATDDDQAPTPEATAAAAWAACTVCFDPGFDPLEFEDPERESGMAQSARSR